MKVLLIYPDTSQESVIPKKLINIEPLGLEYLAGTIPEHQVEILDMKLEHNWQKKLEEYEPEVVGISGTVIHSYRMLEILKKAKELNPLTLTIIGGTHATLSPDDFNQPWVDVIVLGHRVSSFRQIVQNFERKKSFEKIEGIALPQKDKPYFTLIKNQITSLDHLPLPRRDLTQKYRKRYFHLIWRPTALIVTSAGCPYQCNFCSCPVLTGGKFLTRSPELVLEELSQIKEEYIYAGDDNFFFDYEHALKIYQLIKDSGIKKQYYILSRVDEINRHPDIVEKWAEIGLKKVFLGLESFKDEELKSLNKKCTVEKNNRAIEILHNNKVDPLGAFVIQPYYKKEDFDALLEYMDKMKIYYHEFTILTPFPGTEFFDKVKGQLVFKDNRLFDLAHSLLPTELPSEEFYRLYSRLYRKAFSPLRALKIKPTVSPFAKMGFLRLLPGLFALFYAGRKAYRDLIKF
ncbi:MAG: B12-binding domain-containing radical SAM protein [candidate division Zixibacteria bacterium]|nr:B12-binding domain-containing radical SAM protein [candidate division Zixibacteria bacterium]